MVPVISRRGFAGGTLATAISAATGSQAHPGTPANPNIVFLFSDDHSVPDLGCYGAPVRTPHLDRLCREGIRFTQAFVTSPQCSPSRASVFTGRSPHAIGCSRLHAPIPADVSHLIDGLKTAGYYAGAYRKVHAGASFQKSLDFYGDRNEAFSTFFEKRPAGKPFFLQIGFYDPHRAYQPGAVSPPHAPASVRVPPFLPDTAEVRRDLALYYDEISRLDRECGEVLALLKKHGLTDNTMVVFAADNGMPFPRAKGSLYDPGIGVPLIVRWPGRVEPGSISDELVSFVDLPATWLAAAGAELLPAMEGRSLVPLLEGRPHASREAIYSERNWHDNWDPMRCVRTRRYKLIQNYRPELPYRPSLDLEESPTWKSYLALAESGELRAEHGQLLTPRRPPVELYDLDEDPNEFRNLAAESRMAEVVGDLQGKLSRWMQETNDFLPPPLGAIPIERYRRRDPL